MANTWINTFTDTETQFMRHLGDRKYELIQTVWLDVCKGDEGFPDHNWVVVNAELDMAEVDSLSVACVEASYGMEDGWRDGKSQTEIDETLAPYIFDQNYISDENVIADLLTKDEAEEFLQDCLYEDNDTIPDESVRAKRRKERYHQIRRKKSICEAHGFEYYDHDGQYDKGKVHCGCPLCKPGKKERLPSEKEVRESAPLEQDLKDYKEGKEDTTEDEEA